MQAVILAAGMGRRLFPHTRNCPKCLLDVGGMSILERQILHLRRMKVKDIYVVIGHGADAVRERIGFSPDIHFVFNPEYNSSNVITSLMLALPYINSSFFVFCADCVFEGEVLDTLSDQQTAIVLATTQKDSYDNEAMKVNIIDGKVGYIGKWLEQEQANGEFIGLAAIYGDAVELLKEQAAMNIAAGHKNLFFGDVVNDLIQQHMIAARAVDFTGQTWCEVDYEEDLRIARQLFARIQSSKHA